MEQHNNSGSIIKVQGLYKDWFLDYASYVILERAIPALEDGLKPVQRRIMHAMKELEDGRYNKVANIVGHTMQYHPHGDASIADAIVQLGQKGFLIDTQGNWGNIHTGDSAAASRYIEARLTKFALQVLYSPKITSFQLSYDGRKKEPIHLPVKFPMLLMLGAEGIAVGLSTKILPHNFNELINASIKYLKGHSFILIPDFPTGGIADFSQYNAGERGSRIRVRSKIEKIGKNGLIIRELPFGSTTTSLIDSIVRANEKNKIKIKKIEDNTSDEVEILIHLPSDISQDKTISALYVFTDCEINISPSACIIENNRPQFISTHEILKKSVDLTVQLHENELIVQLNELESQWHQSSLERIFIEHKIYRNIEEAASWEEVLEIIKKGLKPFETKLKSPISEDDIVRLTEIKIKKISKFDLDQAKKDIEIIEKKILEKKHHIEHIVDYTITYFKNLKQEFGKGKNRKTLIQNFEDIEVSKVAVKNQKLYVNKTEGFFGTLLKKEEFVCECSEIDEIISFTESGNMVVKAVDQKVFVEKKIIDISVFKKKDERTIYNMIYMNKNTGISYIKRFFVSGITKDKIYKLTDGKDTKVLYLTRNPNGEAEKVNVILKNPSKKEIKLVVDFSSILIKSRNSRGNIVSKCPIHKVILKEKGVANISSQKIWFNAETKLLNKEEKGIYLGKFNPEDKLIAIYKDGTVKYQSVDFLYRYENDLELIEKLCLNKSYIISYFSFKKSAFYAKKITFSEENKPAKIIPENANINTIISNENSGGELTLKFNDRAKKDIQIPISEIAEPKSIKSLGIMLGSLKDIKTIV